MSELVLSLFKPKKKKEQNNKKHKRKTNKQFSETPEGGAGAWETPEFLWFLAFRKRSTLQIWKYSAIALKPYMLNSESISETFHLQVARRDTVVTGSFRKSKFGPWKAAAQIENVFTSI